MALSRKILAITTTALTVLSAMPALAADADEGATGLEEIIVTAQKREQSVQDIPIAVTAMTADTLQANRIYTVNDLSGLAPGMTVKPSAGGISTPTFTMRGQVSYGVVAGSDKQVSIYVDGVYISSPRGSIFDLPDVTRIEVLRGPQGTLFGRNATAGAVSVSTRDPSGEPGVKAEATIGNHNQYRMRMTAELPAIGPISAYGSFVRNYRRGDIQNAGAGVIWDRTLSPSGFGVKRAAKWLGSVDSNSYFAAVKFEPSDSFKLIYKYDRNDDNGTPEGTAFVGYDPTYQNGLVGNIMTALVTSQNVYADPTAKRPKIVANSWAIPREQQVQGHSATATWRVNDDITIKNIMAFRKARVFAPSSIDGLSGLTFTQQTLAPYATLLAFSSIGKDPRITSVSDAIAAVPRIMGENAGRVGQRYMIIASQAASQSKQWSDELQINYSADKLNLTAGAMWFHSSDNSGGPLAMQNTFSLSFIPANGVLPLGNEGHYTNKATSIAAYAQVEYKLSDQLEVVAGARITKDKKSSSFRYDIARDGVITTPSTLIVPPVYKKSKPNFMIGLNYTPNSDMLIYGKFSTSFVSGGTSAGVPYAPETAKSFELGMKADFFDRRLRANLALFHVDYNHFQAPQGTNSPFSAALIVALATPLYGATVAAQLPSVLSTYVADQGKIRAKGFELELTAAPVNGLTLGANLGYTKTTFPYIEPTLLAANNNELAVTNRPKWTSNLFAMYETRPLFGDATLMFRTDALWRSTTLLDSFQSRNTPQLEVLKKIDPYWIVNGRIALRNLDLGGVKTELAVWGKNLANRKDLSSALIQPLASSANFVAARTYGLDLAISF